MGRWQGHLDVPLSDLGERQAVEAAVHLGPVDAIWASDLVRARRTAELIAASRRLSVTVDARFRERHGGAWQGLTRAEIEARWPGHLEDGRRPEGYESHESVVTRALAALNGLAATHPDETVLVVTHGGVVRTLERELQDTSRGSGADLIPNLGGRYIERDSVGAWRLGDAIVLLPDDSITAPSSL